MVSAVRPREPLPCSRGRSREATADLIVKKSVMQQKLLELKNAGEDRWDRVRRDVEAHIADFEKSVKDLDAKFKQG